MKRRPRRALLIVAAVLAPVVAVAELAGHVAVASGVPTAAEWDRVAQAVRAAHDPSELVVVAPRWAEPHARARLGDDVMPLAHLGRADVSRFLRAVEIDLGARSAELSHFTERSAEHVGPFVVRHLENPAPEAVVYDFVEELGPRAHVRGTEPAVDCAWSDDEPIVAGGLAGHPTFPRARFVCPGGLFMTTAVTVIADEKFLPRRCIWAHPFEHGDKVITWNDVPIGRARRLAGHHGMYWVVEREGTGADVEIEVRVGGVSIGTARHADGDGWSSFSFDLPPAPADSRARVELAIRTGNYQGRHYCVEASLR